MRQGQEDGQAAADEAHSSRCSFNTQIFDFRSFPEVTISLCACIMGAVGYTYIIVLVRRSKQRSMRLDASAANSAAAVILPSFVPLLWLGLASSLMQLLATFLFATICDSSMFDHASFLSVNWKNGLFFFAYDLSYDVFVSTLTVLFFLRTVSTFSFRFAFFSGSLIAVISASVSTAGFNYVTVSPELGRGFELEMDIIACGIHVLVLGALAFLPSRRESSDWFIMQQLSWRLGTITSNTIALSKGPHQTSRPPPVSVTLLLSLVKIGILPMVVYYTLLKETMHWRGALRRKRLSLEAATQLPFTHVHPEAAEGIGRWLAQPRYETGDTANERLMSIMDETPATFLIDHSFLEIHHDQMLGRGSTSSVFKGALATLWFGSTRTKVDVAVKIITPPELDVDTITSFYEEFQTWGILSERAREREAGTASATSDEEDMVVLTNKSPRLVRFFGMCVLPPHLCLVFELCESSLFDCASDASLCKEQRMRIARDCASAVEFLHSESWLHRDLKLANFLLNSQGHALLTDLGTCVKISSCSNPGPLVGTIEYLAPELLACQGDVYPYSRSSDVYALATCVFGVVANDAEPFRGLKSWAIREKISIGAYPYPIQQLASQVNNFDQGLVDMCVRCWSKDPSERPSASRMLRDLQQRL